MWPRLIIPYAVLEIFPKTGTGIRIIDLGMPPGGPGVIKINDSPACFYLLVF